MEPKTETCLEVEHLLPLYVGADLETSEMDLVAEHLNECDPCRSQNLSLLEARERISRLAEVEWTQNVPDVWPAIHAGLVEEKLVQTALRPKVSAWQRVRVGGLAAAAALVVSIGALQWLDPSTGLAPADAGRALVHEPSALPTVSGPSGGVTTVSNGGLSQAPLRELPIPAPVLLESSGIPATGSLRRAMESDTHLIDHARPVGLGELLRPASGAASHSLVGNKNGLRRP